MKKTGNSEKEISQYLERSGSDKPAHFNLTDSQVESTLKEMNKILTDEGRFNDDKLKSTP